MDLNHAQKLMDEIKQRHELINDNEGHWQIPQLKRELNEVRRNLVEEFKTLAEQAEFFCTQF